MSRQHEESPLPPSTTASQGPGASETEALDLTSRRTFLGGLGGMALATLATGATTAACGPEPTDEGPTDPQAQKAQERRNRSYDVRYRAAVAERNQGLFLKQTNGDEERYPNRICSYSKGLPHNDLGEVEPEAYNALLRALDSGRFEDFEAIPKGGRLRLANPLGGLAYDLLGPDAAAVPIDPPPAFASSEAAAQMAEMYWMALCRDIPFTDYDTDPTVAAAIADLNRYAGYKGPKPITPKTVFRLNYPGTLEGPMVSQFLLLPFPYEGIRVESRLQVPLPVVGGNGIDFLTAYEEWLACQRGFPAGTTIGTPRWDPVPRYIFNLRALGQHAGVDIIFTSYLRAALILFGWGDAALSDRNPYKTSLMQSGFGTFGQSHLLTLIGSISRATRYVIYNKWFTNRYPRPDAFGGRVHNRRRGAADYPLHPELLDSPVLDRIYAYNELINQRRGLGEGKGSYLLPIMMPTGSPVDPSHPAGHAFGAGTRVALFKAWFREDFVIPNPVKPNRDGTALEPYVPGVDGPPLTLGGELNKLAHNLSLGRDAFGVHYRADSDSGNKLGEDVAIRILREERATYAESNFQGFAFTRFDGTRVEL